jgi:hypothetical protein
MSVKVNLDSLYDDDVPLSERLDQMDDPKALGMEDSTRKIQRTTEERKLLREKQEKERKYNQLCDEFSDKLLEYLNAYEDCLSSIKLLPLKFMYTLTTEAVNNPDGDLEKILKLTKLRCKKLEYITKTQNNFIEYMNEKHKELTTITLRDMNIYEYCDLLKIISNSKDFTKNLYIYMNAYKRAHGSNRYIVELDKVLKSLEKLYYDNNKTINNTFTSRINVENNDINLIHLPESENE